MYEKYIFGGIQMTGNMNATGAMTSAGNFIRQRKTDGWRVRSHWE